MKNKKVSAREISWDPEEAESGGFLDGVSGTIESAECVLFDYAGKIEPVPAIKLVVTPDGADESVDQHITAGRSERLVPSKDGQRFIPAKGSKAHGLSRRSNAFLFISSLREAGFPISKLVSEGIGVLEGLYATFVRVPAPKMSNVADDEGDRERTVLNVSEILALPWEKGKKKAAKAKADEDEDEDTQDEDDDEDEGTEDDDDDTEDDNTDDEDDDEGDSDSELDEELDAAVMSLLKSSKYAKGIKVDELPTLVFQVVKKSPNKKALVERIQDDDYLSDESRPFSSKNNLVKSKK
jgi:hypothetical protein